MSHSAEPSKNHNLVMILISILAFLLLAATITGGYCVCKENTEPNKVYLNPETKEIHGDQKPNVEKDQTKINENEDNTKTRSVFNPENSLKRTHQKWTNQQYEEELRNRLNKTYTS